MTGRTHLVFGITTAAIFSSLILNPGSVNTTNTLVFAGLSALGSVAPDLDTKESGISKMLPGLSWIIRHLCGCGSENFDVHRTYTHDVFLWIVIALVTVHFHPITLGFFFGYLGHLFLDSMTVAGIPYLYFIHRNECAKVHTLRNGWFHLFPKALRFKTTSIRAKIVPYALIVFFGYLAFQFGGLM